MPGPYRGQVVRVHSDASIDPASGRIDRELVKRMLAAGMLALTGDTRIEDSCYHQRRALACAQGDGQNTKYQRSFQYLGTVFEPNVVRVMRTLADSNVNNLCTS